LRVSDGTRTRDRRDHNPNEGRTGGFRLYDAISQFSELLRVVLDLCRICALPRVVDREGGLHEVGLVVAGEVVGVDLWSGPGLTDT
jgi:hypothetical protein